MPTMVVFILIAFVLYTIAIFAEKFSGELHLWMVAVFALGFLSDLTGTFMMTLKYGWFLFTLHAFCGDVALLIMFLHLLWALVSLHNDRYSEYFHKYSIYAWSVWMLAFLTGAFLT